MKVQFTFHYSYFSLQILNGSKNSAGKSKIHVSTKDFVNYYIDRWCALTVTYIIDLLEFNPTLITSLLPVTAIYEMKQ